MADTMQRDVRGKGRHFNVWALFKPASDLPGQWVAHVLDLDTVTQGNSLAHAMVMAVEAALMVASDDLVAGRDPLQRSAPEAEWAELRELQSTGEFMMGNPAEFAQRCPDVAAVACQIALYFPHAPAAPAPASHKLPAPEAHELSALWARSAARDSLPA